MVRKRIWVTWCVEKLPPEPLPTPPHCIAQYVLTHINGIKSGPHWSMGACLEIVGETRIPKIEEARALIKHTWPQAFLVHAVERNGRWLPQR